MAKLKRVLDQVRATYDEEGLYWVFEKGFTTLQRKWQAFAGRIGKNKELIARQDASFFVDVMFINGCDYSLPHPIRYRVDHQIEQLEASGYSCFKVDAWNISERLVRNARMFIVYRCPYTDELGHFIEEAKKLNKRVLYDIDDLVIDTAYTDKIPFIQNMSAAEKALYDDGVNRMRRTMLLCDGVITTTEGLAEELAKVMPKVFINRNCASDTMFRLSNEAVYWRDVLPYLSPAETPKHMKKIQENWRKRQSREDVFLGYFSGSITHNDDFNQIIPVLVSVFERYSNVKLMVVGELDIPNELQAYESRIIALPFCKWTKLPSYIAQCDINLVPLMDSVFNNAKSENKWVEAALVKVPTVASNIGPFAIYVEDGVTGVLCDKQADWEEAIGRLVEDDALRKTIGSNAYDYCKYNCVTIYNTLVIRRIVDETITNNIAFVMPNLNLSGGVLVALKHGSILRENGYDVSYISLNDSQEWVDYEGERYPVLDRISEFGSLKDCPFRGRFDRFVATLWDTLDFVRRYPDVVERMYLVQGFEIDFNQPDSPLRILTARTYQDIHNVTYLTISRWCYGWLEDRYGTKARFAPNGLDLRHFYSEERVFDGSKIKVLIEGDCGMKDKNIDEAFAITNQLDPSKYEIWYMNYTGKTKPHYRIDNNLGAVSAKDVPDVYRQCHILLKTSKNESFSFPPLEMMATGGFVVVLPNDGNVEYIENGVNCLTYETGNFEDGIDAIEKIVADASLRDTLREGAAKTAHGRDWGRIEDDILNLYR